MHLNNLKKIFIKHQKNDIVDYYQDDVYISQVIKHVLCINGWRQHRMYLCSEKDVFGKDKKCILSCTYINHNLYGKYITIINGNLIKISNWNKNKRNGQRIEYHSNGMVKLKIQYKNNKKLSYTQYDDQGRKICQKWYH
jgi:hypothetical protein